MADANNYINYSLADIQRYLQGSMSAKEMHDLEHAALEDPFLADALEGFSEADMQQTQTHLAQIETAIRQQDKAKVVPLPAFKKYRSLQVAASVVLLACIISITYFIFNKKSKDVMLVKNENNTTSLPDSVPVFSQKTVPPVVDTTAIVNNKKVLDEKKTSIPPNNKHQKKSLQPAILPAPAAMASSSDKAAQEASSVMTLRAAGNTLAGTVTDTNQQPIPNAKIILQDSTLATTDKSGNFTITTNDSSATASITAIGYKPIFNQQLTKGNNNITLKERPFLLSDVEVTNIGTLGKKVADTTSAIPQGGWQSFQKYVYTRLHKKYDSTAIANAYISGDLQLEFSINEAGEPIDFKVLHTPNAQIANEAINAVKAGPLWINSDKNSKMRITVKY